MKYYGYVQQSGMYETLDLVVTPNFSEPYADYYKNTEHWYLAKESETLKDVIHTLWFSFTDHSDVDSIKVRLEDDYTIDMNTIKIMFAEELVAM